ncbi:lipocalin family protein [Bacteroides sp. AN502(2024)]|uniref:lipocalin family protein n=1 Tax=Bacteroides sp. AN502(2024) TaxID=3160599 RepID=UPI0035163DCF
METKIRGLPNAYVHIDAWEKINGEQTEDGAYSGPYDQGTIVFTAEGRISITEEGEPTETASYTFTGDKLIIKYDDETTEVKVLTLSDDKLILEYSESSEGYESYTKIEFRRM